MVTMAQRIEALRIEKGLSRPGLSVTLGFPKNAVEKFETGRATPTQQQQEKMADFFGVSLFYLRGETNERSLMDNWLNMTFEDEPAPQMPVPKKAPAPAAVVQTSGDSGESGMMSAFLKSKSFQTMLRTTVLEVLKSPEGQELLAKAVRKEMQR